MSKQLKKNLTILISIFIHHFVLAHSIKKDKLLLIPADSNINPLLVYSNEWSNTIYQNCNTAKNISYINQEEKNLIWILNMVRLNPQLFLKAVLLNPKCSFYKPEKNRNSYDKSLIKTLLAANAIKNSLLPDSSCYISAHCHAYYSGIKGYVGHERVDKSCKQDFYGECCQYGYADGLSIVLDLLLDYDVPTLGHRKGCLSEQYKLIGVSIQPHTKYQYNSVVDFK